MRHLPFGNDRVGSPRATLLDITPGTLEKRIEKRTYKIHRFLFRSFEAWVPCLVLLRGTPDHRCGG